MTPKHTLWLHVGVHKSGTTSIQRALQLRKDALQQVGIATYHVENAWALANLFIRPELVTTPRLLDWTVPPDSEEAVEAGLAKLRTAGQQSDVIVSSEEFCLLRSEKEAAALASAMGRIFARVVPVVTLRNLTDWRASRHSQLRKSGTFEAQKALPDDVSTDGAWYYDMPSILECWRNVGAVRVSDYDDAVLADGSILPAFARTIGQEGLFDGLDLRLNVRPSTTQEPDSKVRKE